MPKQIDFPQQLFSWEKITLADGPRRFMSGLYIEYIKNGSVFEPSLAQRNNLRFLKIKYDLHYIFRK